jgi:hypothetical protein
LDGILTGPAMTPGQLSHWAKLRLDFRVPLYCFNLDTSFTLESIQR